MSMKTLGAELKRIEAMIKEATHIDTIEVLEAQYNTVQRQIECLVRCEKELRGIKSNRGKMLNFKWLKDEDKLVSEVTE